MNIAVTAKIGHCVSGSVGIHSLTGTHRASLSAQIGTVVRGLARNAVGFTSELVNDITMARQEGYIIADASGIVGYSADRAKQRDIRAKKVKDSTGVAGGSDEN